MSILFLVAGKLMRVSERSSDSFHLVKQKGCELFYWYIPRRSGAAVGVGMLRGAGGFPYLKMNRFWFSCWFSIFSFIPQLMFRFWVYIYLSFTMLFPKVFLLHFPISFLRFKHDNTRISNTRQHFRSPYLNNNYLYKMCPYYLIYLNLFL